MSSSHYSPVQASSRTVQLSNLPCDHTGIQAISILKDERTLEPQNLWVTSLPLMFHCQNSVTWSHNYKGGYNKASCSQGNEMERAFFWCQVTCPLSQNE